MPQAARPRTGSPWTGCSILTTSAPHSANTAAAAGTRANSPSSTTLMPSSSPAPSTAASISGEGADEGQHGVGIGPAAFEGAAGGGGAPGGDPAEIQGGARGGGGGPGV